MADTSSAIASPPARRRWTLWSIQIGLAAFFLLAGYGHASLPIAELAASAPWAADMPLALLRFIGVAEIAGALGLILPAITHRATWLTWPAAAGLALIMILAVPYHIWRGEPFVIQLVIAAAAGFVAWGRAVRTPVR